MVVIPYHRIKLKKTSLLPISELYHIEPVGIGTFYVESLTGYISRLSEAHMVSTTALFGCMIAPLINKPYMLNISSGYKSGILGGHIRGLLKTINGMGRTAFDHVRVLQRLTLRQDLINLTFLPWAEVLSEVNLTRSFRSWCPHCLNDRKRAGEAVYEQLLWTLWIIEICPLHYGRLESRCPHCKCESLPILASGTRPGHCSNCHGWLGNPIDKTTPRINPLEYSDQNYQIITAKLCGELIATAPRLSVFPKRIRIATATYECISRFSNGNARELARRLNMAGKTIDNWRSGYTVPRLDFLIHFCHSLGISLIQFMLENLPALSEKSILRQKPIKSDKGFQKFIPFDEDKVRSILESSLSEDPSPSLITVSKRCGLNRKKLRLHFPELCFVIVNNYRIQIKKRWIKIKEEMQAALIEHPPLSMIALSKRLGYSKPSLYRNLPVECHKVAARFLEYQHAFHNQSEKD